jgi:hypothetical protein
MQQPVDVFEESRRIEQLMKNGYSWFDMMYPRGSDAEARELKIGKYAVPNQKYPITVIGSEELYRLSGKKRPRKY